MSTKALADKIEETRYELEQLKQIRSDIKNDTKDPETIEKALAAVDKAISQTERDLNILLKTPSES